MLDLRVGLLSVERDIRPRSLPELPEQHDLRQLVRQWELQPVHRVAGLPVAVLDLDLLSL